ncbi:DUF1667 domain-containing protein [Collinsella aerofaciens]|uniref:DUF1667 domain-containing protein n=2 Tax=Collinsella aerofaciens TaxID=74426 RepID=UPI00232E3104|nr:DUF1667 domain-containing protein [Collinsella aerofaciens]MDB1909339.1 DUF1667 domain-containing protein [Collinsella aerofaciens]MDB1911238.1 DUF1667 domain-containing protein [Collinsella aerofaciens]MDB1913123.1 DUF1667 domain-containing protein [Collinsella aerofaciens]
MSDNVIETLKFNCTICPSECLLTVEVERDADGAVAEVRSVTGNRCPRGDKFAHQELTCPMRVLTTTVAVSGGDEALLPVRTAEAIPLELHAQAMALIRGLVVNAPIRMGDVVLPDLLNTNINLIASMDIDRAQVANWGRALLATPPSTPPLLNCGEIVPDFRQNPGIQELFHRNYPWNRYLACVYFSVISKLCRITGPIRRPPSIPAIFDF